MTFFFTDHPFLGLGLVAFTDADRGKAPGDSEEEEADADRGEAPGDFDPGARPLLIRVSRMMKYQTDVTIGSQN